MTLTPRLASATHGQRDRHHAGQYVPLPGECWYHVLYGHVPRHQMDTILRPVIPSQRLHPQHFAQLQPYIKLVMPPQDESFAFALCNLSCEDTQHQPGRGGLAMVVSTRVSGLRDHALRDSLVFAHAAMAIDERLTPDVLGAAAIELQRFVLEDGIRWYRSYYTGGQADSSERAQSYLRQLTTLPRAEPLAPGVTWQVDGPPPHNLLLIDCGEASFAEMARCIAQIGCVLYRTNLRWASISTGIEEIPRRVFDDEEYALSVRLLRGRLRGAHALLTAEPGARLRQRTLVLADYADRLADESFVASLFGLSPAPGASRLTAGESERTLAGDEKTKLVDMPRSLPLESRATAALPVVAASPEPSQPGPVPDNKGQPSAAPPPPNRPRGLLALAALGGLVCGALGGFLFIELRQPHAPILHPQPSDKTSGGAAVDKPAPPKSPPPMPASCPACPEVAKASPSPPAVAKPLAADRSLQLFNAVDNVTQALGRQFSAFPEHTYDGSKIGPGEPGHREAQQWSEIFADVHKSLKSLEKGRVDLRKEGTLTEQGLREELLQPYCKLLDSRRELPGLQEKLKKLTADPDESHPPAKKAPPRVKAKVAANGRKGS